LTIINSGINKSGILVVNATSANIYRCNVVRNKGDGITFSNSTDCIVENCIISFNDHHGIALYDSNFNTIYCSLISYNINNAGIYLLNAHHNQISGRKEVQIDPFDYYISSLFQQYHYNLSDINDFLLFSKSFLNLVIGDFFDQLYYFPTSPPTHDPHVFSTEFLYTVKNKFGVILEESSENSIHHIWIQENTYGFLMKNTMDQINPISFNFISCNEFGVVWDNASLDRFELNNICYNQHNGIIYSADENPSVYQPYELLLSGNMMLNNDSFFPLFDYLSINGQDQGFTLLTKISSFLTYLTVVPMMTPLIFSQVANAFRNETKMFIKGQIFFGLIFLFFPVFLKIVKMSEEPPLIRETYY
jgi:parallel beta-helix repeat protein